MHKRDYLEFLNSEHDNAFYVATDITQDEKERQDAIKYMRQLLDDMLTLNQILKKYDFDRIMFIKDEK